MHLTLLVKARAVHRGYQAIVALLTNFFTSSPESPSYLCFYLTRSCLHQQPRVLLLCLQEVGLLFE
jgi:hypothetical protein